MSDNQSSSREQGMEKYFFRTSAADFKKIPGIPIAYWVSKNITKSFDAERVEEWTISEGQNKTANNDKYVRNAWEVSLGSIGRDRKWLPYAKGGDYRKWYGNKEYLVDWSKDARDHYRKDPSCRIIAEHLWYRRGITWTLLTSSKQSFRLLDEDETFDMTGSSVFVKNEYSLEYLLAFLNCKVATILNKTLNPTLALQIKNVRDLPIVVSKKSGVVEQSSRLLAFGKNDWDSYEISCDFTNLPLLHPDYRQPTLNASYQKLRAHWRELTQEMQRLEEENNRIFIDAYGLQGELTPEVPLKEITLTCNPHYRYGGDKSEEELETMLLADTMRELVSYAVGCMFGRYSLDKPGLILANQGETLADYLAQVPQPSFPADDDNVIPLLDGDWFPDDITLRFRQFLRVAFGDAHYEDNLAFIEQALNVKGKRNYSLRDYFLGEFYAEHVKRFKKRPIYWLFSSPKGTFSALVYLHRYRPDTVSVVLSYLRDFRKKLASRLDYLQQVAINPSASQSEKTKASKEADTIKKQLIELDDYERDTLYPLATEQVELDLDHGVKVNYLKLGAALKKIVGLDAKGED